MSQLFDKRFVIFRAVAYGLTFLATVYVVGFLAFGWFQHPPDVQNFGNMTIYANYGNYQLKQKLIALTIALATLFIWVLKPMYKKLTLIPLALSIVIYVLWAMESQQLYTLSEDKASFNQILFLHNATLWDIAVFLVVLASIICLILTEFGKHRLSWKQQI